MGILGGIAAAFIIFVAILGYKEYTKIKIKNTSVSPDGMKSPEYLQQAEKKSKFRKLVEKMTGTTDNNYHSRLRTPNVYDRSYLNNDFNDDAPMPVIPQVQRHEDFQRPSYPTEDYSEVKPKINSR